MINQGIIKNIDGNRITIKLFKSEGCSHCSACSEQNKYGKDFEFTYNKKAEIGDLVTLEISEKNVIKAATIAYIMPPFMMIVGYLVSNNILNFSENISVLGSFIGLFISFILLFIYDKAFAKNKIDDEIKIISVEKFDPSKIEMIDKCSI